LTVTSSPKFSPTWPPIDGEALAATRKVVELLDKTGLRPEQLVDGIPKDDLGIRIVSPSFDDLAKAMWKAAERSEQAARAATDRVYEEIRRKRKREAEQAREAEREWKATERKRKAQKNAEWAQWKAREQAAGRDFKKPYVFREPLPQWRQMTVAETRRHVAYILAKSEVSKSDAAMLDRIATRLNSSRPRRPTIREIPRLNELWQAIRERNKPAAAEPRQPRKAA
jgi:hypothetical protein